MSTFRGTTATAVVILLAGLFAGCSTDPEQPPSTSAPATTAPAEPDPTTDAGDDFCAEGAGLSATLQDGSFMQDVQPDNMAAGAKAIQDVADRFYGLEAPSEISTDWTTVADGLADIAEGMRTLDLTAPDGITQLSELVGSLSQGDLAVAAGNIDTYVTEHCG